MKSIRITEQYQINLPPQTSVEAVPIINDIRQARENSARLLEFALSIESITKTLILKTLFSEVTDKADLISGLILDSDWCTLSAKRKLLLSLVDSEELLEGKEKNSITELYAKVIRYRNALTHGDIVYDGSKVVIKYFEGTPRAEELTDDYWNKAEVAFSELFDRLHGVHKSIVERDGPAEP